MRRLALWLISALLLVSCASPPAGPPSAASTTMAPPSIAPVDPAHIKRIRPALPAGYEIADVAGPVSAAGLWGFGAGWSAQPPQCATLADPAPADPAARGYSASGPGGIVYVVVATPPAAVPVADLGGDCAQWSMTFAHTSGAVRLIDAPQINGAETIAMAVDTRTVVESGTETDGQAVTALAWLDGRVVYVTLVTDPGSVHAPLSSQFVGELLVKTVSALRD
ncbi:DUF5642 family protein [Mycolicibacterium sp. CBM1]